MPAAPPNVWRSLTLRQIFSKQFEVARHVFLVAAPVGVLVGAAIAAYDYVVNVVLWERFTHTFPPLVLSLLPIAGMLLTGLILSLFRVASSSMADEVVKAYHRPGTGMEYATALPKLAASIATMGFGASAGMEGASKWLGGSISSFLQNRINATRSLRLLHGKTETTLLAGAAAGISAIFRAPLTGAIMGIESPYKNDLAHESLIHGLVAAATSYATFAMFRPATPYFPISFTYQLNLRDLLLCVPLGIAGGLASHLFLGLLLSVKRSWGQWRAPRAVKMLSGGMLVSGIALAMYALIGAPVTLQAGLPVANELLAGKYTLGLCLLIFGAKLLATVFTFGTGGVGGLFVPSATIGAALGAAFDAALHPSQPGLFTLIGIAAFTGASYNSLLFSAVFVAEATGSPALVVPSLIASCTAFLVSAGISNSESQQQRRPGEGSLQAMRCGDWMSTALIVAHPHQTISSFMERALLEHSFNALPAVDEQGHFVGMVSLRALRSVARERWDEAVLDEIIDRGAAVLQAGDSMAEAEEKLTTGPHDYVPVVEPASGKLAGIISSSDVRRARRHAAD